MKKFSILALLCATLAITPAFAEMNLDYNTPSVELSTQSALLSTAYEPTTLPTASVDLSFAFNDIENLQAKDMTLVEMQETEGAWSFMSITPYAVGGILGGASGHYGYLAGAIAGGAYNPYAHGASVLIGAGVGAIHPIRGASAFTNGAKNVVIGTGAGAINGYSNTLGVTHNLR